MRPLQYLVLCPIPGEIAEVSRRGDLYEPQPDGTARRSEKGLAAVDFRYELNGMTWISTELPVGATKAQVSLPEHLAFTTPGV